MEFVKYKQLATGNRFYFGFYKTYTDNYDFKNWALEGIKGFRQRKKNIQSDKRMQKIMTLKILKIFEKLTHKIIATISTMSVPVHYKVTGILHGVRASRKCNMCIAWDF